jgi:hypothetical protein
MMNFDLSLRRQYKRPLWLRRAKSEMYIRIPEKKERDSDNAIFKEGDSWIEQAMQKTKLQITLPRRKLYGDLEETAPMIRGDEWIPALETPSAAATASKELSNQSFSAKRMLDLKVTIPTEKYRDIPADTRTGPVDVGDSWITLRMMGESDATLNSNPVSGPKKMKWYKRWFFRSNKTTSISLEESIKV